MNPTPNSITRGVTLRDGWGVFAAKAWVLFSAWCSLAGWGLSLCGRLDAGGYLVAFGAGALLFCVWARQAAPWRGAASWKAIARRFRRPAPFIFLLAAVLTLIGGVLYAPTNFDALTYRLPRVYHWLMEGRWHWINGVGRRENYSGVAFEWLMAPTMALSRGERLLFLMNFLPWLVMPGATFGALRGMGVRGRVAWWWMWLMPLGYCYVLQAGGIGNDSYAVVYLLLSVHLALRARKSGNPGDLWIAAIALALCTGTKASNIPLFLPFAIAAWPARRLVMRHPFSAAGCVFVCVMVSFLPLAAMNQKYTGKWTGDPKNLSRMQLTNPTAAFIGNALEIGEHNLEPPLFGSAFNGIAARFGKTGFYQSLVKSYPRLELTIEEMPIEEGASAGCGLAVLFLIALAGWRRKSGGTQSPEGRERIARGYAIAAASWVALGIYMVKMGSESAPRLVASYYPLCFALALLHPGNDGLARARWWHWLALAAMASIFPALILSPSRPLWPVQTLLPRLMASHPGNKLLERTNTVYSVYSHRSHVLAPLVGYIPPGEKTIAFLGGDDPANALWHPYGARKVVDFSPATEEYFARNYPHIYVITSEAGIRARFETSMKEWLATRNARVVAHLPMVVKIQRGDPEEWYVVELQASTPGKTGYAK